MTSTQPHGETAIGASNACTADMKLEVVVIPVSGPGADGAGLMPIPICGESVFGRSCEVESRSQIHKVGKRTCFHLSHHLAPVRLHCNLADIELATDLFIQHAGGYQRHYLPFATGE